jgi:hypothetical protein
LRFGERTKRQRFLRHLDAKLVDAFFNTLKEAGDPRSEARKAAN